jgi:DNA-directed RNA polymerase III subunit RPC1
MRTTGLYQHNIESSSMNNDIKHDDDDDDVVDTAAEDANVTIMNAAITDEDIDDNRDENDYYTTDDDDDDNDYDDDDMPCPIQKRLVRNDMAPKRISHIQFGMLSPEEMQRLAEFQVCSRELFTMPSRQPAVGGCLDPRLGVSDKLSSCATCHRKLVDCAGHFGYIKLALPVFHIGFLKHTLNFLQCICKSCSRVLLIESEREKVLRHMRNPNIDALAKMGQFKRVVEKCKKCKTCPYCNATNGTVKKITGAPTLKIIHERYRSGRSTTAATTSTRSTSAAALAEDEIDRLLDKLDTAIEMNRDIEAIVLHPTHPPVEDLLPTRVLELFQHIPNDDCELLWIDPVVGRPENLILQNLLVPPVPIRPSVAMDVGGGSNEDDLTVKLQEIMDVNVALELALSKGPQTRTIVEEWDFLQVQVAQYINGEMPGMQRPMSAKPMRGLCQRLKGKQGRFRGNLR